jgi:hypothetical protein
MKRSINGFTIDWGPSGHVMAERETEPKYGYYYEAVGTLKFHAYVNYGDQYDAARFKKRGREGREGVPSERARG